MVDTTGSGVAAGMVDAGNVSIAGTLALADRGAPPPAGTKIQIVSRTWWGRSFTGTFSTVAPNPGYSVQYDPTDVMLAVPQPPASTAPPTISGNAIEGQTLTESHGAWSPAPTSFAYQWQDCAGSGAKCTAIPGATGQTYTLSAGDVDHTIRVQETASDFGGAGIAATSAPTKVVCGFGIASGDPLSIVTNLVGTIEHCAGALPLK
ncbi:MAG: hypothetical protein ACYDAD_10330 [Acidimicrobiales bacterium]